jgi:hypothetical protein
VYDIVADPWERTDLSARPVGRAVADRYRGALPDVPRRTASGGAAPQSEP